MSAENSSSNDRAAKRRICFDALPDGSAPFLRMHQLWEMTATLPVKNVPVSGLSGLDEVLWFGGPLNLQPTCRAVAEHARDIYEADLAWPVILSPSGELLDGMHRLCKAILQGKTEIAAVQLTSMPECRWRLLPDGSEVPMSASGSSA